MTSAPGSEKGAAPHKGASLKEADVVKPGSDTSVSGRTEAPSPDAPDPGNQPEVSSADGSSDGPDSSVSGNHEAEVESDLDELIQTAAKRDEYLAFAQRTQADFENYRKRMAREVSAAADRGVAKLVRELLPALDNLERALAAAAEGEGSLTDGVRLVQSELLAALGRVGITTYSPEGETFDPQQHEAMAQQPVDGVAAGTVAEVYQSGYRLGETIIRPARVVVAA